MCVVTLTAMCRDFGVSLLVAQDVARLIVERSTIMNSLFSRHACRPEADAVLSAFLLIFSAYIRRMRKTKEGEDLYSWVRPVDLTQIAF